MRGNRLYSTSDIITYELNWHCLYSSSAGGKHIASDTQIRVIGSIEDEICTQMLRNLSEKLRTKFPSTTFGYSVVRISCLGDALAGILELESGSKPSIRSTNAAKRYQKENKER